MGKIKTESGVWIPATYKSNRYTQWKERNKADHNEDSDGSDNEGKGIITLLKKELQLTKVFSYYS